MKITKADGPPKEILTFDTLAVDNELNLMSPGLSFLLITFGKVIDLLLKIYFILSTNLFIDVSFPVEI